MRFDRDKQYQIYYTVLCMALTYALTLSINYYYGLRVHLVLCAVISFFPPVLIYIFDRNRKNMISYIALISVIPITAIILWILKINPVVWIRDLLHWCWIYDGSKDLYVAQHAIFIVFFTALIGTILFYLIARNQTSKVILAVFILLGLVLASLNMLEIHKLIVGICIFYMLTVLVELYGMIYGKKTGRKENKAGILYLAPVCLLLAILSILFPSKQEPIQWTSVKNVYKTIRNQIDIWMTEIDYLRGNAGGDFTLAITGYADDSGDLGSGSLTDNSKVALRVHGYAGNAPVYLIGSVSDVYTGNRWDKSMKDYLEGEEEYLLDYLETLLAMSRQDREVLENEQLVERRYLRIQYNNIKTKTLFYPIKSSSLDMIGGNDKTTRQYANIRFPKAAGDGTQYTATFFEFNFYGEAFQKILQDGDDFSYSNDTSMNMENIEWLEKNLFFNDNVFSLHNRNDILEVLEKRAAMIKEHYTGLPENFPQRVRELTLRITKNSNTDYDRLKAIEAYLHAYNYSVTPGVTPKDRDFVDYFLFDNQEGYCTAFASAMALMARSIGIPTRYVEGFILTFEDRETYNTYVIRNNNAHAWTEAYLEGVGWVPFEPTAPFRNTRYVTWKERIKRQESSIPDYSSMFNQQRVEEMIEEVSGEKAKGEEEAYSGILTGTIIVILTVAILLLALLTYYLVLRYHYKKTFDRADYSKKSYMLFLRILQLLKREGFSLGSQETILMLSKRVKDLYHYDRVIFADVGTIFMRYRYAETEITSEEYEKIAVFHKGLDHKRREETNRMQVWFDEFLYLMKRKY